VSEHPVVREHEVIEVRVTGRAPEAVSASIREILNKRQEEGWELHTVQPVIYNSSTTGYFLLFFQRAAGQSFSDTEVSLDTEVRQL
jgi:hypothetical protein